MSEFESTVLEERETPAIPPEGLSAPARDVLPVISLTPTQDVAAAAAVVPSYQDLTSDESSAYDSEGDDEQLEAVLAAAEAAFTDEEIEEMSHFLKERGLFSFMKRYVAAEAVPLPKLLLAFGILVDPEVTSLGDQLRMLKIACSRVLRQREKLEDYNTLDDAVDLIRDSKNIMVLTGAGVSTSCGIPDFRSPTGLYARLKEEHWDLDDPQEMFDLDYFKEHPNVFYSFAKEIYPSNFTPSPCHRFVKVLELREKLLRNYTQNIDGLFEKVGVSRMLNCHGSFATASCLRCRTRFPGSAIEADIFAQRVALCPLCTQADAQREATKPPPAKPPAKWSDSKAFDDSDGDDYPVNEWADKPLVKPDIVFFGEKLSDEFDHKLLEDREKVDLLIVIGTSLRVAPVAQIVSHLPHSVPQILINRDPVTHANFDIVLLGDGDTIVSRLCKRLGDEFDLSCVPVEGKEPMTLPGEPDRVADSHVWLFPGANGGRWVEAIRQAYEEGSVDDSDGHSDQQPGADDDPSLAEYSQNGVDAAAPLEALVVANGNEAKPATTDAGPRSRQRSPDNEDERDVSSKKSKVE